MGSMIADNVKNFLKNMPEFNSFGEKITLVAAVKTQSAENICQAVEAGIRDIGDNHVQEFRDKYAAITGNPRRHFIGHLQTNKIKYLLGRCDLYQSVDRLALAEQLAAKSSAAGVVSNILLQINAGNEESKGGFSFDEIEDAYAAVKGMPALKTEGLMAMLPLTDDRELLQKLATQVRKTYDRLNDGSFKYLSMGMSGDWRLCVECGSNMIRIGTALFGPRN